MLPQGHWVMLASASINNPKASGRGYVLARVLNKHLVGEIIVHAMRAKQGKSLLPAEALSQFHGLYKSDECDLRNPQKCLLLYNLFTGQWAQWGDGSVKLNSLTRAAIGNMAAKGISYPQDLIIVHFIRVERWGSLDIAYAFNPETEHISSSEVISNLDTEWAPVNIKRFPDKTAYIEKLRKWGDSTWAQFEAIFDGGK
jgi:hypothetical protein